MIKRYQWIGLLCFMVIPCALPQTQAQDATTTQLDSLDEAFRSYMRKDWDSARIAVEAQLELTKSLPMTRLRGRALKNHGDLLRRTGETDSSIEIYQHVLDINQYLGDTVQVARMMGSIAGVYVTKGEVAKAKYLFEKALPYFKAAKDTIGLAITYQKLAKAQREMSLFNQAIQSHQHAIQLLKNSQFPLLILGSYNGLGLIYKDLGKRDKALEIFLTAIHTEDQKILEPGIFDVFANIADIYMEKSIDSAKIYLDKAVEIANRLNLPTLRIMSNRETGLFFYKKNELDSSLYYYFKSKEISKNLKIVTELIQIDIAISKVYRKNKNYVNEEKILLDALEIAERNAQNVYAGNIHHILFEHYRERQIPSKALTHIEKYLGYIQDQNSKEQIEKFKEIELTFEFKQQQLADSIQAVQAQQLAEAKFQTDLANERQQRTILYAVIGVIGLTGMFALYGFAIQRKQAQELSSRNQQIETLLKEIHHRVKNNLQVVSSLLDLQSHLIEDQSLVATFQEGKNRVKAMGLIHQQLYQHDHLASVDFTTYAHQLADELAKLYSKNDQVAYAIKSDGALRLDVDTAIPLGLILNELISNAYKYAFEGKADGQLTIQLDKTPGQNTLVVRDNGQGLPEGYDWQKAHSLGLRLVKNLSRQIRAKVEYSYENGSVFRISFRETQLAKA